MTDQEKLEQIVEILLAERVYVGTSNDPGYEGGWLAAIKRAAARILEMNKPKWYYPSKGEYPPARVEVIGANKYAAIEFAFWIPENETWVGRPNEWYNKTAFVCWMYKPTPPTERSAGDE